MSLFSLADGGARCGGCALGRAKGLSGYGGMTKRQNSARKRAQHARNHAERAQINRARANDPKNAPCWPLKSTSRKAA